MRSLSSLMPRFPPQLTTGHQLCCGWYFLGHWNCGSNCWSCCLCSPLSDQEEIYVRHSTSYTLYTAWGSIVDKIILFDTPMYTWTHTHTHNAHTRTHTHIHTCMTDSNFQPFWSSMRTWQNCFWVSLTIFFATCSRACAGNAKLRPLWATSSHAHMYMYMQMYSWSCTHVHVHADVQLVMHTCTCTCRCTVGHAHMYMYMQMYSWSCTHVRTYGTFQLRTA